MACRWSLLRIKGRYYRMNRVATVFKRCRKKVALLFPLAKEVELHLNDDAGNSPRSFAWCQQANGKVSIHVAAKLEKEPDHRIEGILRHEFGHAVDFLYSPKQLRRHFGTIPKSAERFADVIAEEIWGDPILYEPPLWVQSIWIGVTPRPAFLPK